MNLLNYTRLLAIPAEPFTGDVLLSYTFLAVGLTLIGLFSRYKIFCLIALGPIIYLMYHISDTVHEGYLLLMACLAGWILFNVYAALAGDNNE